MTVKVSSKYQVDIPEEIRKSLGIKPGTKIEVLAKGRVAYLVPVPELSDLQDSLSNEVSQKNLRDKTDRKI